MQTSRGSGNEGQGSGQPGHTSAIPLQSAEHGSSQDQGVRQSLPSDEFDVGSVTIFRTAQFFVHAAQGKSRPLYHSSGNTTLLEQIRWVSTERQRVLEAETRLLPQIDLINPVRREIIIPGWFEAIVILLGLAVAIAVHGFNLFGAPQYQAGEGLLMAHAWSITQGQLAPFGSFTFEQLPFGWLLLAAWSFISGGFTTFGSAINSGRALMLVFSSGCALFVYLITTRLSGSRSAGLLALVLFALSPLGVIYQRQVLLENVGVFWLLLSLFLLVVGNSRLPAIVFAGVSLGLAVLTQGIFIIFFPVMLYTVWLHATPFQRKFALVAFSYIALSLASTFVLFALLSGQILPGGDPQFPGPSLVSGIGLHIQTVLRESNFLDTWNEWMQYEWFLIVVSGIAVSVNIWAGIRKRLQWLAAFFLVTMWMFMLLTGIISPSYFSILLPLMSINIAIALNSVMKLISQRYGFDLLRVLLIFSLIGAFTPYRVQATQSYGLADQNFTQSRVSAIAWIRENVSPDATIVVNSDLFVDLRVSGGPEGRAYERAFYYQNELFNPDRSGILENDWRNIDYIVLDPQMERELRDNPSQMSMFERALHDANLVKEFVGSQGSIKIYQVIHPEAGA